jgi:DNA polymerase-1
LYAQYKAQRPPTPDELKSQIRRVHEFAEALGMPTFELQGYEADDLLGTLALQAHESGILAAILTGDRDLLQMVQPGVMVLLPGRNFSDAVTYDEAAVEARFGVRPVQLTAFKALVGDASDNIPGVPGVGEKTAAKLLSQFGSFESLFERVAEVTPPRVQAALSSSDEQARQSRTLATILTDMPVRLQIEECAIGKYDRDRAVALLKELEFNSLVSRLPSVFSEPEHMGEAPQPTTPATRTATGMVYSEKEAAASGERLERAGEVVLCAFMQATEPITPRQQGRTTPHTLSLRGIGVSTEPGRLTYMPSQAASSDGQGAADGLAALAPVLKRGDCLKVSDDVKSLLRRLTSLGLPVTGPWFDLSVAAHLVGEKAISLPALALSRLGTPLGDSPNATDLLSAPSDESIAAMLAPRAAACWALRTELESDMREREVLALFHDVEMPLVPVLAEMENNGILVDTQKLHAMSRTLGEQLASLEIDIYNAAGHRFNINSPKQLGTVLFDELHVQNDRRMGGSRSTEAAVLETLREGNPIIDLVLRYRQLSKLKSTYVDTLPAW